MRQVHVETVGEPGDGHGRTPFFVNQDGRNGDATQPVFRDIARRARGWTRTDTVFR
jgi:hypothetical protein